MIDPRESAEDVFADYVARASTEDWLALLALHAIFTIFFFPRTRVWTAVTAAFMLGLLILYGKGHLPRAVAAIGIER